MVYVIIGVYLVLLLVYLDYRERVLTRQLLEEIHSALGWADQNKMWQCEDYVVPLLMTSKEFK